MLRAKLTAPTPVFSARLKPLPTAMSDKIRSYSELRKLIRASLRMQNPEWVEPNGESPICDSYEARFAELLGLGHPLEVRRRDGQPPSGIRLTRRGVCSVSIPLENPTCDF